MRRIFIDTETNGRPYNYKAHPANLDNWPEIVSIAWISADHSGILSKQYKILARPEIDEVDWDFGAYKVHGISRSKSIAEGIPPQKAYADLMREFNEAEEVICHNVSFDLPVLLSDLYRLGLEDLWKPIREFCTMKASTDIVKLPSPYGRGYKWPKLQELHMYLFGEEFDGAHNALADIEATYMCWKHMKAKALI